MLENVKRVILVLFVSVGTLVDGLAWSRSDSVMASFAFVHVMLTGLVFMILWDMVSNKNSNKS